MNGRPKYQYSIIAKYTTLEPADFKTFERLAGKILGKTKCEIKSKKIVTAACEAEPHKIDNFVEEMYSKGPTGITVIRLQ